MHSRWVRGPFIEIGAGILSLILVVILGVSFIDFGSEDETIEKTLVSEVANEADDSTGESDGNTDVLKSVSDDVYEPVKLGEVAYESGDKLVADRRMIDEVSFTDSAFEEAIRILLNKDAGDTIYQEELDLIRDLNIVGKYVFEDRNSMYIVDKSAFLEDRYYESVTYKKREIFIEERGEIKSLEDINKFPNLNTLTLVGQHIEDITPLKGNKNLISVDLTDNFIKDISAMEETGIVSLTLNMNKIEEVTWSNEKVGTMQILNLAYNHIKDGSFLEGGKSLRRIDVTANDISERPNLDEVWEAQFSDLDQMDFYWEVFGRNPFMSE